MSITITVIPTSYIGISISITESIPVIPAITVIPASCIGIRISIMGGPAIAVHGVRHC